MLAEFPLQVNGRDITIEVDTATDVATVRQTDANGLYTVFQTDGLVGAEHASDGTKISDITLDPQMVLDLEDAIKLAF